MVYDDLLSDLCYYNEYKENSSHHREAAILLINFSLCSGYAANLRPDINGPAAVGRDYFFNNSSIALLPLFSDFSSAAGAESAANW